MNPQKNIPQSDQQISDKNGDPKVQQIKPSQHRLILKFLNEAVRVEDLMYGAPIRTHMHPTDVHPEHHDQHKPKEIITSDLAKKILEFRDRKYPLGFRQWEELLEIRDFHWRLFDELVFLFSNATIGEWNDFPVNIPRGVTEQWMELYMLHS